MQRPTWPILARRGCPHGRDVILGRIGRGRSTPAPFATYIRSAGCNHILNARALEARMLLRTLTVAALLVTLLSTGTAAQNASSVVAAASKAMGVDTLNSITYSGTARNGAFGQSKSIGDPMGPVNVTRITRVHAHDQLRPARPTRRHSSPEPPGRRSHRPCRGRPRRCRACSTRTSPARRPAATGTRR